MLHLLNVWSYLYRPGTPFKVICHHYAFTSHSAITRADTRMDEFSKCSTRTVFLEVRGWICFSCLHWCEHFHSLDTAYSGGADLLQETSKAVSGKMFTFLSKLLFWEFSAVITAVRFVCMSQVCSIPWSWPSHMHFSHVGMEEDGWRWLIVQRSWGHPSHKKARHIYLQEKKLNRRCFTVQVSEWSSNVNPLHVSREGLGHEAMFLFKS